MIDGALLLDKPVGISSNRALQEAKKLFGARKAGHAGTLDPLASGLLLVLFGEATKFAGPLLDSDKEYVATLKLGERTTTGDAEGSVLETKPVQVTDATLARVLDRFRGEIEQRFSGQILDGRCLGTRVERGMNVRLVAGRRLSIGFRIPQVPFDGRRAAARDLFGGGAAAHERTDLMRGAHQRVQQPGMQPLLHINVSGHGLQHQYPTAFPLLRASLAPRRSPVSRRSPLPTKRPRSGGCRSRRCACPAKPNWLCVARG